jgi:hypothetical protein
MLNILACADTTTSLGWTIRLPVMLEQRVRPVVHFAVAGAVAPPNHARPVVPLRVRGKVRMVFEPVPAHGTVRIQL